MTQRLWPPYRVVEVGPHPSTDPSQQEAGSGTYHPPRAGTPEPEAGQAAGHNCFSAHLAISAPSPTPNLQVSIYELIGLKVVVVFTKGVNELFSYL